MEVLQRAQRSEKKKGGMTRRRGKVVNNEEEAGGRRANIERNERMQDAAKGSSEMKHEQAKASVPGKSRSTRSLSDIMNG